MFCIFFEEKSLKGLVLVTKIKKKSLFFQKYCTSRIFFVLLRRFIVRMYVIPCAHNKKEYMTDTNKISKTLLRILCVVLAVIVAFPVEAQSWRRRRSGLADGDHYHFGYISGHVGYSILDTRANGVLPLGKVGGGIGAGYEYRNSGLWANVGIQFSMHRSQLQLDPRTITQEGKIRDGIKMIPGTLYYDVKQTDEISWNFVDVPILLGYYTHGFHIGAGLKISYALNPQTKTHGSYDLRFQPNFSDAIWSDMPDRGLTTYTYESNQTNRLNIGASLIGEIGYDLLSSLPTNSRVCHVLKMSFYFEYGLNNYNKGEEKERFTLPAPDENGEAKAKDVIVNPYLNTTDCTARVVPFIAGVKFTYMIGGSRTARAGFHHGCMCYQ